jgi:hypothetical protein
VNAVYVGLFDKLTGDATLVALLASAAAVYRRRAPQGSALPYVILAKQTGSDTYTYRLRVGSSMPFLVKAVTQGPSGVAAQAIADRIDALLTDGAITVSGKTLLYCRRETHVEYDELAAGGTTYQHVGGIYRIEVA